MNLRGLLLLLAALLLVPAQLHAAPTQVLVVPSLHGLHAHSSGYDFDKLYTLVADFKPAVVGVEIRPEDIQADAAYLKRNYPPEMIALRDKYAGRVIGFDWLGSEIAGRPIPADWWTHGSKIKALERKLDADPAMRDPEEERISREQQAILESATPASLADGRYDKLVREQRERLARSRAAIAFFPRQFAHAGVEKPRTLRGGLVFVPLVGRGEVAISKAFDEDSLSLPAVQRKAFGLLVLFVPGETQPAQPLEYGLDARFGVALYVGIVEAQHHGSMVVAGIKPVEYERASAANVKEAGG